MSCSRTSLLFFLNSSKKLATVFRKPNSMLHPLVYIYTVYSSVERTQLSISPSFTLCDIYFEARVVLYYAVESCLYNVNSFSNVLVMCSTNVCLCGLDVVNTVSQFHSAGLDIHSGRFDCR